MFKYVVGGGGGSRLQNSNIHNETTFLLKRREKPRKNSMKTHATMLTVVVLDLQNYKNVLLIYTP